MEDYTKDLGALSLTLKVGDQVDIIEWGKVIATLTLKDTRSGSAKILLEAGDTRIIFKLAVGATHLFEVRQWGIWAGLNKTTRGQANIKITASKALRIERKAAQ